jgi:hypothetical protein
MIKAAKSVLNTVISRAYHKVRKIERPKEYWEERKAYQASMKEMRIQYKKESEVTQQKRKEDFITK